MLHILLSMKIKYFCSLEDLLVDVFLYYSSFQTLTWQIISFK